MERAQAARLLKREVGNRRERKADQEAAGNEARHAGPHQPESNATGLNGMCAGEQETAIDADADAHRQYGADDGADAEQRPEQSDPR